MEFEASLRWRENWQCTCLHYVLNGVDPFANVYSVQEVRQIETQLLEGRGTVGAGAEILTDATQAG